MLICIFLLLSIVVPVQAEGTTIPAGGQICAQGICNTIQITFPPKGGPVTGTLDGTGNKNGCAFHNKGTISGTFAGGDGGKISGKVVWTMIATCGGNSISTAWNGTWQGTLSAKGTGSGSGNVQGVGAKWTLTFSGEDFKRISAPITKEYFKSTYGIDVVDGTSKWTDHQLVLLDNLIKKLPKSFWDKAKFTRIVRDKVYIDRTGVEHPNTSGCYEGGETKTIQIFDLAAKGPFDFKNDPSGDLDFTSTMAHEMTHAYLQYKDYKSMAGYNDRIISLNPVIDGFTTAVTDNPKDWRTGWVWNTTDQKFRFRGKGPENKLMTEYAGTDMEEDLCESVGFYVVDPANLGATSPNRYAFIKDQMFGGQENSWDY